MPYCPSCRHEYERTVERCSDCGQTLVSGEMPTEGGARADTEEPWISLLRVQHRQNAEIVEGLLQSSGIECQVIDKELSEMPIPAAEGIAYVEVWVPRSQAAEARAALDAAREGTSPCHSCGHMTSVDEAVCEYCGAST